VIYLYIVHLITERLVLDATMHCLTSYRPLLSSLSD